MQPEKFEQEPSVEDISAPKRIDLREEMLNRTLLALAIPAILDHLLHSLVHVSDTLIAGWLHNEVILAAALLGGVISFLSSAPFFALTVAANSLVSRCCGAEKFEKARRYAGQCLSFAFMLAALIVVTGILLAGRLMDWIGAAPDVAPLAAQYLRILLVAALLGSPMWVANAIIRATGDTKTPMKISALTNLINIPLSIVLAFGLGPVPQLGLMGVAWGTVFSRSLGGVVALGVLLNHPRGLKVPFRLFWTWDRSLAADIWRLGAPTLLERIIWNGSYGVFTSIVAKLGTVSLAANNIALHVESLAFMPAFGAAHAVAAYVGQAVGANCSHVADLAVRRALKSTCFLMACLGMLFVLFGKQIAALFGATPEVVGLAGVALQISALEHPLMASGLILSSTLQGAGDTRSPLYVMTACILLFRFGVVYLFAITFGWGLPGVWLATAIDWAGRSIGLWGVFRVGKWRTIGL